MRHRPVRRLECANGLRPFASARLALPLVLGLDRKPPLEPLAVEPLEVRRELWVKCSALTTLVWQLLARMRVNEIHVKLLAWKGVAGSVGQT